MLIHEQVYETFMKSFTFIIYGLWTGEFWVVNIGVWCLHNGSIVVYLCCIIEIFVISCRKSWQARGAGEAGGQVFRGGVIHGVWNGLCYKLHEYSCADGKSKGITISSNIKSNGMLRISFSLKKKKQGGKEHWGLAVLFLFFYWNTPKGHICSLTDFFGSHWYFVT